MTVYCEGKRYDTKKLIELIGRQGSKQANYTLQVSGERINQ